MNKRAVLYTRVSSNKKEQELSLLNQREVYEEYCVKNGYELLHIYAEKGLTGTNARRKEFKQMMYDAGIDYEANEDGTDIFRKSKIREPKFDYIITKDVSRYSRSRQIGMETAELLHDKGVYIIFENSGVNTEDENWGIMLPILFTIAQSESANMSKKIQFSKKHNAEQQKYRPARLPYGFIRDENKEIIINKVEEVIIKFIYDSFSEIGSYKLTKILNEQGHVSQGGHEWTGDKILRIIKNPIYTGTAIVNRSTKKNVTDTSRTARPVEEHIPIYNAVPPIVTVEQWTVVNKIREKRINTNSKRGRKPVYNDIYFNKVFCENCGSRFVKHTTTTNTTTKTKKINYMCQGRRKGKDCNIRGISINNLNRGLAEIEVKFFVGTMSEHINYKNLIKQLDKQATNLNESRLILDNQINELELQSDNYVDQIASYENKNEKLAIKFEKKFNEVEEEKTKLENQRDNINIEEIYKLKGKIAAKKQLIESISKTRNITEDEKLQLLLKVNVGDNQLEYFFAMPNFNEEISEFNSIFTMNPIEVYPSKLDNLKTIRRDHKQAREFWEEVDETMRDNEEYNLMNPYTDEDYLKEQEQIIRTLELIEETKG